MQKSLHQSFSVSFEYPVYFTRGLFSPGHTLLAEHLAGLSAPRPARCLVVLDDGLLACHPSLASDIQAYMQAHPGLELAGECLVVPGGEAAKNDRQWADLLLEAVEQRGIDRHAYLIALGGGAVLDMAGFAAAVAHRGVRHIRVPTTVLAQNDSGVGVKNGINAFGKKNFTGAFAPPTAVFNDSTFLSTLDPRDWRSGMAEAVKVSLIKEAAFFRWLEANAGPLNARELPAMEKLIYECARLHMEHIAGSGDPFEKGSSRPLDFGHWSAHKLEQLTRYELRHGEAVAIGLALDSWYAHLAGLLGRDEAQAILDLLQNLGFELYHPALEWEDDSGQLRIWQGLREFREHLGGRLTIMLLEAIGKGIEVHRIEEPGIRASIRKLKAMHQPAGLKSPT
jgi:3-dehydroquinate synthase